MTLIPPEQRELVRAAAALVGCNPFLPERLELDRRVLGSAFVPLAPVWHAGADIEVLNPNTAALRDVLEDLGTELRRRLVAGTAAEPEELAEYHRLVLYLLFLRYEDAWYKLIEPADDEADAPTRIDWYEGFENAVEHFYSPVPALRQGSERVDAPHLFALGFQARRAFHHIFRQIFGGSLPAARLRATVWRSIFTVDVQCYREAGYTRMANFPTLITGATGTGKELVARAIALSCYVPFDPKEQAFVADPAAGFCALNLSAVAPTLLESALFGHGRGAFTGATQDRRGWFESCGPYGAIFLDEIGEADVDIQIKLLRVLEGRTFHRVGETMMRPFAGRVIAATNRDLKAAIAAGHFRSDFYFRLRGVRIVMPTLREQLADTPGDLHHLVRIIAGRVIGAAGAEELAAKAQSWIDAHLGADYAWPGNMRELEQCVRDIFAQGEYVPEDMPAPGTAQVTDVSGDDEPDLTADEVVQRHCAAVYAKTGSYQETARRLGLDRRTVRAKVDAWTRRAAAGRRR